MTGSQEKSSEGAGIEPRTSQSIADSAIDETTTKALEKATSVNELLVSARMTDINFNWLCHKILTQSLQGLVHNCQATKIGLSKHECYI